MPEIPSESFRNYNDFGIILNIAFSIIPWFCWAVFIKEFSKCPENMNVLLPTMLGIVPGIFGCLTAILVAQIFNVPSKSPNRFLLHAVFWMMANGVLFASYFAFTEWSKYVFGSCF